LLFGGTSHGEIR